MRRQWLGKAIQWRALAIVVSLFHRTAKILTLDEHGGPQHNPWGHAKLNAVHHFARFISSAVRSGLAYRFTFVN